MNLPYIVPCAPIKLIGLPSAQVIIQLVAARRRMTPRELCGPHRDTKTYLARNEAIRIVYTHTTLSVSRIGRLFNRHHATILYSLGRSKKSPNARLNRIVFPAQNRFSQGHGDGRASCMSSDEKGHI